MYAPIHMHCTWKVKAGLPPANDSDVTSHENQIFLLAVRITAQFIHRHWEKAVRPIPHCDVTARITSIGSCKKETSKQTNIGAGRTKTSGQKHHAIFCSPIPGYLRCFSLKYTFTQFMNQVMVKPDNVRMVNWESDNWQTFETR